MNPPFVTGDLVTWIPEQLDRFKLLHHLRIKDLDEYVLGDASAEQQGAPCYVGDLIMTVVCCQPTRTRDGLDYGYTTVSVNDRIGQVWTSNIQKA